MKLFYACLVSVAMSGAAIAGGPDAPIVEPNMTLDTGTAPSEPQMSPDTIVADTAAASSADIIVPITALILLGTALAR